MTIKALLERFNKYAPKAQQRYKVSYVHLLFDYFCSYLQTKCSVKDYFNYQFYLMNSLGKKQYVTGVRIQKWFNKNNNKETMRVLANKPDALMLFKDYINRDWCDQTYHNTEEEYQAFSKKHPRAIVKPLALSGGKGIEIVDTASPDGVSSLYEYCKANNLMVEELIIQTEQMSRLISSSVNTVRVIYFKDRVIGAVLRMGRSGMDVDNASSGGVYAEVDIETGIVCSLAYNYDGDTFVRHPDTGCVIPGFEIPKWNEVTKFVISAAKLVKGIPLIGFDIAITDFGPTIIEANSNPDPFILQNPKREGIAQIIFNDKT